MKKYLFTFIVLGIYSLSYAQTNIFPSSGNVGIGTITPSSKLDVKGLLNVGSPMNISAFTPATIHIGGSGTSTNLPYFVMENSTAYGGVTPLSEFHIQSDGTNVPEIGWTTGLRPGNILIRSYGTGGGGNINLHSAGIINFLAGNTQRMVIDNNGNVGIGTVTPGEAFDVKNNVVFGASAERLSMSSGSIGFNRRTSNGAIYNTIHSAYQFQHIGSTIPASDYLALQVYNGNGSEVTPTAFTINGAAQVGINTSYIPTGYRFAVNGDVLATSITVKLKSSWPDYVFHKSYVLQSLPEVERFIKSNHHLPGIPSAKEVEEGINLGEMDSKLLKKIEELTLYMIELKKENEQIKSVLKQHLEESDLLNKE